MRLVWAGVLLFTLPGTVPAQQAWALQSTEDYVNEGIARGQQGDLDGAIADFNEAIRLHPKDAKGYYNRGLTKNVKGDIDGAIADYDQTLLLDPKNALAYFTRGVARVIKGKPDDALSDFRSSCDADPKSTNTDYARLAIWLLEAQKGQATAANQELSSFLAKGWNSPQEGWTTRDAQFLLGQISEADYLAAANATDEATSRGQHCEAWYYSGMKRLIAGDVASAKERFIKAIATKQSAYTEFGLAQAELKAMDQASQQLKPGGP